eukprot:753145-Hanusia_phi.AAC.1
MEAEVQLPALKENQARLGQPSARVSDRTLCGREPGWGRAAPPGGCPPPGDSLWHSAAAAARCPRLTARVCTQPGRGARHWQRQ